MTAAGPYDYVIAGAGSAGCVLANRLTENGKHSVLLIEAGGSERHPYISAPAGFIKTISDPRFNWCYETEPAAGVNGRAIPFPRGRVLGGSSAINGHLYVRGQPADFDRWAQFGNPGWSFDDVRPYFEKLEGRSTDTETACGRDGPVHISDAVDRHPHKSAQNSLTPGWDDRISTAVTRPRSE